METLTDYNEQVERLESMLPQEKINNMNFQDLVTIMDILEQVKERIIETPEQDDLEERMKLLIDRVQDKIKEQFDSDT
jgi:hypothetical protein